MGCLWWESEVCESIEEVVVVLVAQERLYLLYWSWIGDSSLLVLNRGMEHLRDVDDHIWTGHPEPGSPRVSLWKLQWRQTAPMDRWAVRLKVIKIYLRAAPAGIQDFPIR